MFAYNHLNWLLGPIEEPKYSPLVGSICKSDLTEDIPGQALTATLDGTLLSHTVCCELEKGMKFIPATEAVFNGLLSRIERRTIADITVFSFLQQLNSTFFTILPLGLCVM